MPDNTHIRGCVKAYIIQILPFTKMDIAGLTAAEIVEKVESGEIPSKTYMSADEYRRAMGA